MANYPQFAVGPSTRIQQMIDSGVIRYPAYIFANDNHKYYFIGPGNTINAVVGDCPHYVVGVAELPETGTADTLYVMDGVVYAWDGEKFKAQFNDYTAQINTILNRFHELEGRVKVLEGYDRIQWLAYDFADAADAADTIANAAEGTVINISGEVTEQLDVAVDGITVKGLNSTAPVEITGNDVTLSGATITSTGRAVNLTQDGKLEGNTITASTGSAANHTAVQIGGTADVVGNTVSNNYNGIEFALNAETKDVDISGNTMTTGNNGISIYKPVNGAVYNIHDNVFTTNNGGNFIRISNSNNEHVECTFNIYNNTLNQDDAWGNAIVLMQDYSKQDTMDFTGITINLWGNTYTGSAAKDVVMVYADGKGTITYNQPIVNVRD